jgi:very-short-patch-repair endonuclease
LIEIDGRQHFEDVKYFHSNFEDRRKVDHYKQNLAIKNGYNMIRIVQEHVWKDKIDWKNELINTINTIKQNKSPNIYYISGDDRYIKWHNDKI